jgi:hypothetical protein
VTRARRRRNDGEGGIEDERGNEDEVRWWRA